MGEGGRGGEGAPPPLLPLRTACTVVFVASFCSMALEIAASRLLAPHLGVSLYSWTGIIGVVLAGVMFGNWAGGRIADQSPKKETLGTCLFLAGLFSLLTLIFVAVLSHNWDPKATAFYIHWPARAVKYHQQPRAWSAKSSRGPASCSWPPCTCSARFRRKSRG